MCMKREILILILLVTLQSDIFCNSFDTWEIALNNYLHAYACCPDRIEPLVMIARHYIEQGNLETAYMFARRACEQAVPQAAVYDARVYTYDRYDVLSACASSVGELKLGMWAIKEALKVEPTSELLHERLCYYHEQLVIEAGRTIANATQMSDK